MPGRPATGSRPSRPAPLAAAKAAPVVGRRVAASKPWLVLAGGGLFVAVAAIAAWQFSGRRDGAAVEQAGAASAAANVVVTAPAPQAPAVPAAPIIIETADPSTTSASTKDAKTAVPVSSATTTAEAGPRASIGAPGFDPSASGASRVRPAGKPVPRVGEDPALASSNGNSTTRPLDSPTPGLPNASSSGERHPLPGVTPQRDYPGTQRPTTPFEFGAQSVRDVCKGSFFERNVCMDERCEEARFRSTPECMDVLARKRKRGQGQ